MARPKTQTPAYVHHKPSGRARVRINVGGRYRDVYLGEYGSPESLEKYHRLLAENLASDQHGLAESPRSVSAATDEEWTVAMLAVKYDDFASSHYVKDGRPTDQRYRAAIEPLVQLFGDTLASDFGPKRFQALREHIIRRGSLWTAQFDAQGNLTRPGQPLSRDYVNNLMKAVARIFKWAVTEEKVPASVPDALAKVGGLRKGRDARLREAEPVRPVLLEHFWPVVKAASPPVAAMLQVQRLTGMRPDEVTIMRPCDLDRGGEVWVYRPESHKLEWLDQNKEVLIGPQAQQVLAPWLGEAGPDQYLFSPRRTAEWNVRELEKRRRRPSSRRVPLSRKRAPREHYDDPGYRQAVVRACRRAGIPEWSPGQLRHSTATEIRRAFGAEAAQLVLGQ